MPPQSLRRDVRDRLAERPPMAGVIDRRVLALPVRVVGRLALHARAVRPRPLVVGVDVFNAHHDGRIAAAGAPSVTAIAPPPTQS